MTGRSSRSPVIIRGLPPVTGPEPRVLILGSFPSVLSLARSEYYGNPRNRFWAVMGELFGIPATLAYPVRCRQLTQNGVALWDVAASCSRPGSADARIRDVVPNDIAGFMRQHPSVRLIALNGTAAGQLYCRFTAVPGLPFVVLPSTSPANAAVSFEEKVRAWTAVKKS